MNRPLCSATFRTDVATLTEDWSRFVCQCVGVYVLYIHMSQDQDR